MSDFRYSHEKVHLLMWNKWLIWHGGYGNPACGTVMSWQLHSAGGGMRSTGCHPVSKDIKLMMFVSEFDEVFCPHWFFFYPFWKPELSLYSSRVGTSAPLWAARFPPSRPVWTSRLCCSMFNVSHRGRLMYHGALSFEGQIAAHSALCLCFFFVPTGDVDCFCGAIIWLTPVVLISDGSWGGTGGEHSVTTGWVSEWLLFLVSSLHCRAL